MPDPIQPEGGEQQPQDLGLGGGEQQPDPWAPLQQRGFDPSGYDPDAIVNGANLYRALTSRDYQEGAVQQVLRHAGFPEDVTVNDLRAMALEAQQAAADPFSQFYDDGSGNYAPQGIDPAQVSQMVDQRVQAQIAQFQQQMQAQQAEQAREAEFQREVERVSKARHFEDSEQIWLAAEAQRIRQAMPYATTQQVMDKAGEEIHGRLMRRFQAMSQETNGQGGAPNLPPGQQVAGQQPMANAEDAMKEWMRLSGG